MPISSQRLANDLRAHPRPPHALDRRVDARGVFRMPDSRVVFVEDRMRVNVHGDLVILTLSAAKGKDLKSRHRSYFEILRRLRGSG